MNTGCLLYEYMPIVPCMSGVGGHVLPLRLRCRLTAFAGFAFGRDVPHLRVTMERVDVKDAIERSGYRIPT